MPIDINDAFINAQFKTFVDFARGKDAGTKVRALIGNDGPERTVGAKSECVLNKIFFRVPSNKAVNNEVRTLFRAAVARMFGGEEHIPASVKTAMKLGDYGKGRPLTARRILAVQSALEQIAAKHDDLLQKGLGFYGDRHGTGASANLVKLAFASCHGNADAMDVVDKHLLSIIETGGGQLRNEQGVQAAGRLAGNYLNLLAFCVQKNLERAAPGSAPVEIGAYNGQPDIEGLGGNELVAETISMARAINARNLDAYVDEAVQGRGPAADDAKRIVRNKLGEANNPPQKLGARLGDNTEKPEEGGTEVFWGVLEEHPRPPNSLPIARSQKQCGFNPLFHPPFPLRTRRSASPWSPSREGRASARPFGGDTPWRCGFQPRR